MEKYMIEGAVAIISIICLIGEFIYVVHKCDPNNCTSEDLEDIDTLLYMCCSIFVGLGDLLLIWFVIPF